MDRSRCTNFQRFKASSNTADHSLVDTNSGQGARLPIQLLSLAPARFGEMEASHIDPQDAHKGEDIAAIYRRHPLSANTTRVLQILPPTSPDMSDIISCRLSVISMDSRPEYRALSYVWGDPSATKVILVDNTPFKVRINLWNYLVQARSEERCTLEPRYIWVDAVCINQDDLDERSTQVAIMGQIYSKASEVCAWLGVGTEKSWETMRDLTEIDWEANYEKVKSGQDFELADEQLESAIFEWLELAYWSRVWIIQEYALSDRAVIQCGPKIISAVTLDPMIDTLIKDPGGSRFYGTAGFKVLRARRHRNWDIWYGISLNFVTVLHQSLDSKCTDPHDHIYALISLDKKASEAIVPDYTKSLLDLFVEVTSFFGTQNIRERSAHIVTARRLSKKLGLYECSEATKALRRLEKHTASDMGGFQDEGDHHTCQE